MAIKIMKKYEIEYNLGQYLKVMDLCNLSDISLTYFWPMNTVQGIFSLTDRIQYVSVCIYV